MVFIKQKNLQKSKLKDIRWIKEIFEKYDNLSEDELSVKGNKNFYVKKDVIRTVIKGCKSKKKKRKIDGFRKKLMIPDFSRQKTNIYRSTHSIKSTCLFKLNKHTYVL